jgi:hypothetical protein
VIPFVPFPKIARFNREVVVTEKIDGTNAQVHVTEAGDVLAGSRNRWLLPGTADNFGFAAWVAEHRAELLALGPGSHYGEWWGSGIQRRYGLTERRFSLFNVSRWGEVRPPCCHVVPTLWRGPMVDLDTPRLLATLAGCGSAAAPGFMNPEGLVVFHVASNTLYKRTIEADDEAKSARNRPVSP